MSLTRAPIRIPTISASTKTKKPVQYPYVAEVINMRAAMGGFVAGAANEVMTGKTILEQVHDPACMLNASLFVGLTALGTAFTINNRLSSESEEYGPFTPEAEAVNGRTAMVGALGLAVLPYVMDVCGYAP